MLDETFIFRAIRAKSHGIELRAPIAVSPAVKNVTPIVIPGRNGVLYQSDGSYQNRTIVASCYLLSYTLQKDIDAVNSWLVGKDGYFRFEDTADTHHFMLARTTRGIERQTRAGILNPFVLEFDAKPQRFLKIGEKKIDVTNTKKITNPTNFPARPLIEVSGNGDITIKIFGETLNIYGLDGMITYDAETDTAFKDVQNLNSIVNTSDIITIPKGSHDIEVSGSIEYIKITPRWWEV